MAPTATSRASTRKATSPYKVTHHPPFAMMQTKTGNKQFLGIGVEKKSGRSLFSAWEEEQPGGQHLKRGTLHDHVSHVSTNPLESEYVSRFWARVNNNSRRLVHFKPASTSSAAA